MELGPDNVSLLERCPHFRGWYVQASMELGPEDVSLLERCPHFKGWYVQTSMELGPEDVSLLERCPHFKGWYMYVPQHSDITKLLDIVNSSTLDDLIKRSALEQLATLLRGTYMYICVLCLLCAFGCLFGVGCWKLPFSSSYTLNFSC